MRHLRAEVLMALAGGTLAAVALAACGPSAYGGHAKVPVRPRPSSSVLLPFAALDHSGDPTSLRASGHFSLIGAVWNDPEAALGAELRVRAHSSVTHRWRPWLPLPSSDPDTSEGGTGHGQLGGTPPLWVGPSDAVQVDLRPIPGGPQLPAGLRLALVDSGQTPPPTVVYGPWQSPTAQPYQAPQPPIIPRSAWQPDAVPQQLTPIQYADVVRAVFIHHTDSGNDYSCSDAPDVIRSIEEYHVNDRAWDDIGYNFLVDKCGNIYEGRAGGVDRPVIGAHTVGFNVGTAGIAAIGSYEEGVAVPRPLVEAIARLVAWKLGLGGVDPRATTELTSTDSDARYPKGSTEVFNTVSGHRDAGWTFCPGGALYALLPEIRTEAARLQRR
jgi:hypothetical protein